MRDIPQKVTEEQLPWVQVTPYHQHNLLNLLLLLLLLKEVGSASLRESDIHPISPKTSAPQYQPIDR